MNLLIISQPWLTSAKHRKSMQQLSNSVSRRYTSMDHLEQNCFAIQLWHLNHCLCYLICKMLEIKITVQQCTELGGQDMADNK